MDLNQNKREIFADVSSHNVWAFNLHSSFALCLSEENRAKVDVSPFHLVWYSAKCSDSVYLLAATEEVTVCMRRYQLDKQNCFWGF